jgi:hypothetical protein
VLTLTILAVVGHLVAGQTTKPRIPRDPLIDAIAYHESRGRSGAVGGLDGQCVGLTQVCLHTYPVCRTAGGFETSACLAVKRRLLDPGENLRVAARRIEAWKELCRRTVGRAGVREVVFGFAGADGHGVHCGHVRTPHGWAKTPTPKVVREILELYEARLHPPKKRKFQIRVPGRRRAASANMVRHEAPRTPRTR